MRRSRDEETNGDPQPTLSVDSMWYKNRDALLSRDPVQFAQWYMGQPMVVDPDPTREAMRAELSRQTLRGSVREEPRIRPRALRRDLRHVANYGPRTAEQYIVNLATFGYNGLDPQVEAEIRDELQRMVTEGWLISWNEPPVYSVGPRQANDPLTADEQVQLEQLLETDADVLVYPDGQVARSESRRMHDGVLYVGTEAERLRRMPCSGFLWACIGWRWYRSGHTVQPSQGEHDRHVTHWFSVRDSIAGPPRAAR